MRLPLQDIADAVREHADHDDPLGLLREMSRVVLARLNESDRYRNVYSILANRCEYAGRARRWWRSCSPA